MGVWAEVRVKEVKNGLVLLLFHHWSQQDFLVIGGWCLKEKGGEG